MQITAKHFSSRWQREKELRVAWTLEVVEVDAVFRGRSEPGFHR